MVVAGKDPRKVKLLREAAKQELAARDFKYFLDFVFIQERPQLQEGIVGGKRQFEKWPHVMEIADALLNDRKIVILKARQLGASWVGAAYACWMFMFHPGSLVGMFSRGEREAVRLMAKVKFIYKNLPRGWTRSLETDSRLEMQLNFAEGIESIITAFPSTSDAGRGDDFSLVVMDEADSHEALEEAYTALSGSIDSTGGQMVMMSTINKLRAESVFVEAYTGSPENNWKKLFFGWRARPTRNDEWYQRARNNIPTTSKLTAELYMEQEFPETEEDALKPAHAISGFDMDTLDYMKSQIREPYISTDDMRIYTKYQRGRRYACGSDVAHGIGQDYSVSAILDLDGQTSTMVACIISNRLDTVEFAEQTMKMLELYANPIWAIEKNEWGIDVVRSAERAKYRNLYGVVKGKGKREYGWLTTPKSRWDMWLRLRTEINRSAITIPDIEILDQFYQVVVVGEHGKMMARQGAHDDGPTAMAIALMMNEHTVSSARTTLVRVPAAY